MTTKELAKIRRDGERQHKYHLKVIRDSEKSLKEAYKVLNSPPAKWCKSFRIWRLLVYFFWY
jgi:hypothetical protein